MAKFTGLQQNVGVARETTRGTPVAPTLWVPKADYTVEDKANKALFRGSYSRIDGVSDDALVTDKWAEGDLEMAVLDDAVGYFLYGLFGTVSSADFNSARKHTFTIQNDVQQTTLSLALKDDIGSVLYAMAMVDRMQLVVEPGELARATFGFVAKNHRDWTALSPSYTAENKFGHQHLTFKTAANEAGLSAASKINVRRLELNVTKNVFREPALGTVQPVDILARQYTIEGTIQLTYEDRTYRDFMLDGDKKAVQVLLTNDDVTIGSTNPELQINLPVCHFHSWEPSHPLDDVATQEIMFQALYDPSNTQLIGTTHLVNETNSY